MLESYNIVSENTRIDKSFKGHEELDILRRLRNKLAHIPGRYNPEKPEERKLCRRMVDYFDIEKPEAEHEATRLPTSIKKVIEPITRGCMESVKAYRKKTQQNLTNAV